MKLRELWYMAAGKYDAEIVHMTAALSSAFSGKTKQAIEANPYRQAIKPGPTTEELKAKQKQDFDLIGVALRQVAERHRAKKKG